VIGPVIAFVDAEKNVPPGDDFTGFELGVDHDDAPRNLGGYGHHVQGTGFPESRDDHRDVAGRNFLDLHVKGAFIQTGFGRGFFHGCQGQHGNNADEQDDGADNQPLDDSGASMIGLVNLHDDTLWLSDAFQGQSPALSNSVGFASMRCLPDR
jgi:hypothetical protein